MNDIDKAMEEVAQAAIDACVKALIDRGSEPTPDYIAGMLLQQRRWFVSENIGPLAEMAVTTTEKALSYVLPRCTLTREQLEETIK